MADKVFKGYSCSSFGKQAANRLKSAACKPQTGNIRKRLSESDILFFSGHHYGSPVYDEPLKFEALDLRKWKIKSKMVKLIMASSCTVLVPGAVTKFRRKFPKAYIFGWLSGAPLNQKNMMSKFIASVDVKIDLSSPEGMEQLIQRWRAHIEGTKFDREGRKIGYATPMGTVVYYRYHFRSKKWGWVTKKR